MIARTHSRRQRGIALVTALLLLLLMLSLALGFTLMVTSEQRANGVDLDRTQTFYAAYGAMEQLNAQLGALFQANYAPAGTDINALITSPNGPPVLSGVTFTDPSPAPLCPAAVATGYCIAFTPDKNGNPQSFYSSITQGPYSGFSGQVTNYTITISAQSSNFTLTTGQVGTNPYGAEVRLRRTLQTVAIPVFQFGIFSESDLSFFPGPDFSFGGVVATNGDLYLAGGGTLTLSSQTSAYGDVITDQLSNGLNSTSSPTFLSQYGGTVRVTTAPGTGSYQTLSSTMGSIDKPSGGCPISNAGATPNNNWTTISIGTFNSYLRDGAYGCSRGTGAKYLELPLVSAGASGMDLIKLPPPNEDTNNCAVYQQRYYTYTLESDCKTSTSSKYAMLRILIADTVSDITSLPEESSTTPQAMTPGTTVAVGSGTGHVIVPIPWAMSSGGTTACSSPLGSSPPVYPCNQGDWFAAGWSRLGMGDGTTTCSPAPTSPATCGPYILIQYQDSSTGGWKDKTKEILQLGTTGRNLSNNTVNTVGSTPVTLASGAATCLEPQPDAVIRLQRIVDIPSNYATYKCGYTPKNPGTGGPTTSAKISTDARDYMPMKLFDPREALLRDTAPGNNNLILGGVMNYVELDVQNLARWFAGKIGTTGGAAAGTTGYLVYFSDRRGNEPCPTANCPNGATYGSRKVGNLGWEDFVNPSTTTGTPDNAEQQGEDLLGANLTPPGSAPVTMPLDTYGGVTGFAMNASGIPNNGIISTANIVTKAGGGNVGTNAINLAVTTSSGSCKTLTQCGTTSTPSGPTGVSLQTAVSIQEARVNPLLFFRRALKLTDAQNYSQYLGSTCAGSNPCGLTITSENPVYVEGNYNTTGGSCSGSPLVCTYTGPEAPSAILADAVTMLSSNWNDIQSYNSPYDVSSTSKRLGVTTYYRTAVLAGKGVDFPRPDTTTPKDFGTDGGVHNFLRYIENWGTSGVNLAYNGSIVSFFFNEQGVGTYKCCNTVYSPPGRGYAFDTNFLNPALLPPRTPAFRDINTLGFTQLIMPYQQ